MSGAFTPPKISVVIPTWNRAKLIERAINSALTQTLEPFEILVCDDGSSDGTYEIVQSLASKDARIKWIPGKRSGRAAIPRNRGLTEAKGDWIAFLDSDDVWLRDKLRRQFSILLSTTNISLASCTNAYRKVNDNSSLNLVLPFESADRQMPLLSLFNENTVITSSVVLHSSVFKKTGGFPEGEEFKVGEDYALWLRVATITNFTYISTPLLKYTDSPQHSARQGSRSETLAFLRIAKNYLVWLSGSDGKKVFFFTPCIVYIKTKKFLLRIFWKLSGITHSIRRLFKKFIQTLLIARSQSQDRVEEVLAGKSELSDSLNGLIKQPRVSVLMPVYNAEKYIWSAIQSILNQAYSDFELVIINDASTDGTLEVINSIEDDRIRILNLEKNSGIVMALNKGLEISKGELIVRMDADDISLPTRLSTQVQYLDAHPQVGLVGSWITGFGDNIDPFIHRYPLLDEEIKCRLLFENSFAHSTILLRKSILDVHGLQYDANYQYVEDWHLWSKLSRHTEFHNIPAPLVKYRIAEKSKKYRDFQHAQKQKLIFKNLFKTNFPCREISLDTPSEDRGALQNLASYLCELREANAKSHAFKSHIFERQLSWIWVKSCLGLGKIGFLYSLYDNKKYHLNISNYDILNVIVCMVRYKFSDFIFLKMNNWIRR